MPIFIEIVSKSLNIFDKELSRTLNTQEAVANGCTIQANQILGNKKFAHKFKIIEYNPHKIFVNFSFDMGDQTDGKQGLSQKDEVDLFLKGNEYPMTTTIDYRCMA